MIFSHECRIGAAVEAVHLEAAMVAARKAVVMEPSDTDRAMLTRAIALISEVEQRCRKQFAELSAERVRSALAEAEARSIVADTVAGA